MNISDQKLIITGAGGGIGAYFAERLIAEGARVTALDVDGAALDALAGRCAGGAGRLHTHVVDISDEASSTSAVEWAAEVMSGLTGLVNNAGIIRDGLLVKVDRKTGAIAKISAEDWQRVIDVNLTGAALLARDVAVKMIELESKPGLIVNMSSVARHGNRGQSSYVAAKAALAANTVTWARELCRYGIRVAAIAPGMVETPMTQSMNQKARDALVERIPLGRIGVPEDIWQALRFVIACDYFTGRVVEVDGGLVM